MTLFSLWGFQLVLWVSPFSWRFGLRGSFPAGRPPSEAVYVWTLGLGPVELRRWSPVMRGLQRSCRK